MKKIISLMITAIILITSTVVCATGLDNLKAIDAVPQGITEDTLSEFISRAEFSYMTAKILNGATRPQKATRFSDVGEDNIYSGYIEFLATSGVLSGTDGAMFLPDSPVDNHMVNKILVCALGFNTLAQQLGGYPWGYSDVAEKLNLYKNVEFKDGFLTKGGAVQVIENMLLGEVPSMQTIIDGGEIFVYPEASSSKRLLCDVLGYNAYTGEITKVDYSSNIATIRISSNKYDQNSNMLTVGNEYIFSAINTVNFAEYEQLEVTLWADSENTVVNIIPAKGTAIRYAYIDKVNGSEDIDVSLPVSNIYSVTLVGDEEETDVASNLKVKYNNALTEASVELCGRFARLVIVDNEVVFIESWDLKEGGMITSKDDYELLYTQGTNEGLSIKDALYKKTLRIFIDGKTAGYKDLRVNSVFDFYETDDILIIVASEKVFTEEFKRYSLGNSVEVGNLICMTEDVIYVSSDGATFRANTDIDKLLGNKVSVYIAPNGYAKYIVRVENTLGNEKFYGIVLGVQSDVFGETAEVKLCKVAGASIEHGIYTITNKTKFGLGISIDVLGETAKDKTGKCLYKFETNTDNRILSVAAPEHLYGFSGMVQAPVTHMENISNPYFTIDNTKVYFEASAPITYIYEDEGEFCVSSVTWNSLKAKNANGSTITFYGGEKIEYPEFILMCGGENGVYDYRYIYGVYTGYKETVNDEGEVCKAVRILSSEGAKDYIVTENILSKLEEATGGAGIIRFNSNALYSGEGSAIVYNPNSAYDVKLSDNVSRWETATNDISNGLHRGIIEKIAGNRIFFEDGKALYMTHTAMYKFVVSVDENTRGERFKMIELSEVKPGDEVYYYRVSGEIYGLVVVK